VSSRTFGLAAWCVGCLSLAPSCATEVVLGEHIAVETSAPTFAEETYPATPATSVSEDAVSEDAVSEDAVTSVVEVPTEATTEPGETTAEAETTAEPETTAEDVTSTAAETSSSSGQDTSTYPPGGTWFFEHKDHFPPPYPPYPPYPPGVGLPFDGGVPHQEPPPYWESPQSADTPTW
jgi:hypothetical protein